MRINSACVSNSPEWMDFHLLSNSTTGTKTWHILSQPRSQCYAAGEPQLLWRGQGVRFALLELFLLNGWETWQAAAVWQRLKCGFFWGVDSLRIAKFTKSLWQQMGRDLARMQPHFATFQISSLRRSHNIEAFLNTVSQQWSATGVMIHYHPNGPCC